MIKFSIISFYIHNKITYYEPETKINCSIFPFTNICEYGFQSRIRTHTCKEISKNKSNSNITREREREKWKWKWKWNLDSRINIDSNLILPSLSRFLSIYWLIDWIVVDRIFPVWFVIFLEWEILSFKNTGLFLYDFAYHQKWTKIAWIQLCGNWIVCLSKMYSTRKTNKQKSHYTGQNCL